MSDSNRSSGGTESLALTTAERAYLESGVTGGYRQSTLESRIEEKAESLSTRLNRLAEDVEILSESDRLREDTMATAWENILVEASGANLQHSEREITDLQPASAPSTPLTEFGRNMGNMAHHLLRNPNEVEYPMIITQLVYGFVQGTYIDHRLAADVEEHGIDGVVSPFLEGVQTFAQEAENERESYSLIGDTTDHFAERSKARTTLKHHVKQVLHNNGIVDEPPRTLTKELERKQDEITTEDEPAEEAELVESMKEYRRSMWGGLSVAERTQGHLMIQDIGSDQIPNTAGASTQFWAEHDPSSFDPEKFAPPDRVMEIFESKRIQERESLERRIQRDIEMLEKLSWRGVDAHDVFRLIHQHEPIPSETINQHLESRKQHTAQITRLARDLSGEDHETRDTWDELPLVSGDRDGWKLTEYGETLAIYWLDHNHWSIDAMPDNDVNRGIDALLETELFKSNSDRSVREGT